MQMSSVQTLLSEQSVLTVLDSLEHKLVWLDHRLASERWVYQTEGAADSLEFFERLHNHVVSNPTDFDVLRRGSRLLTDEVDQRRAELILSRLLLGDALVGEHERLRQRTAQFFERLETELRQVLREADLGLGERGALPPSGHASLGH